MFFSRNQQPSATFPAVPPTLSTGEDHYAQQYIRRPSSHTLDEVTPYLGLRARLSQVWINRWTVLLLLVLVRTLLAIVGLNHDLDSAQTQALSACAGIEAAGSAMASMPHFMAAGVNDLAATGVEKAVNGLMSMLLLTVTGVEEIIVFYINMLTSMYVCLITLVISGSLHVALKVVEDTVNFLNGSLGTIANDINSGVGTFTNDLNKFLSAFNSIPGIFGGSPASPPTINIAPQISALQNLHLPPGLDQGLAKLNQSIPDFAQVNNFTNSVLRFPFEEVKKLINGSLQTFAFDRSVFPVPQKEKLTFCSDTNGIEDFFTQLYNIAEIARKAFIGVLLVAALLMCIPMAYSEIRRWHTIQQRAQLVTNNSLDPLDVVYIVSRPYTARAGLKASKAFVSTRKQILIRWVIAYATSPAALFILSLGLAGLFSCLCQYILLRSLEKEVPALANSVGAFSAKIVASLNNASEAWATGTNGVIVSTNTDINNNVFGWVNTTTHALNATLNAFVDEMSTALNTAFGGTVLLDPVTELVNCLIGLKIIGIEKGLTWVSDHAHIEFPLFPNNTFALGAHNTISNSSTAASFLASPGTEATDKITSAVAVVATHISDAIRTEALISTFILAVWLLLVLAGIVRALFLACKRDKLRGEGGPTTAGDIVALEDRDRPTSSAPAYEPPKGAAAGRFHAFTTPRSHQQDATGAERKLGFAGERPPATSFAEMRGGRQSEYGHIGGGGEKF